ncbi:hypothetical protein [Salipaludibacillus sp. CUR1]|nr:hypothetical protein [Salipaludibacillus sp. CUR1]
MNNKKKYYIALGVLGVVSGFIVAEVTGAGIFGWFLELFNE